MAGRTSPLLCVVLIYWVLLNALDGFQKAVDLSRQQGMVLRLLGQPPCLSVGIAPLGYHLVGLLEQVFADDFQYFWVGYNLKWKQERTGYAYDYRGKDPPHPAAPETAQKELGDRIGLAANRAAQYEMGYRVPKKPLLEQMAHSLEVSPLALLEPTTGTLSDIMETLFWMDEEIPGIFRLAPSAGITPRKFLTLSFPNWKETLLSPAVLSRPRYFGPRTGCWTVCSRSGPSSRTAYHSGNITHEQYFEW